MATEAVPKEISRRESRGSLGLWFGLLAAPLAWITVLVATYSLEEWFACAPSTAARGEILGIGVVPFALGLTVLFGAIALAGGVVALRCLRRIKVTDNDISGRARWMAYAGILNTVLYTIAIVTNAAPPLILQVCQVSP
ncbi:MAG: hypothetical protein ACRDKT_15150 [Actinomycetota bacterium]